jgi:predicted DNA repair protein MutK
MSVGLLAVVDDILTAALKASAKTAGVVIDDAAVTPQYVQGLSPARELHVVWRIALGSLFNKFVIIIPLALLLSAFAPWVLPWLLILGGTYLCFEGAEKVTEWFGAHHSTEDTEPKEEGKLIFGAIRTDLILSTEIMLIALASLDPDFGTWKTLGALAAIGLGMTILVYGVVALLVKIDDIGLDDEKPRPTGPTNRSTHCGLDAPRVHCDKHHRNGRHVVGRRPPGDR